MNILSGVDSEGNIDPDLKYENPAAYKALLEIQSAGVVAESEAKESAARAEVYGKVGWQKFSAVINPLTSVLSTISNFMIAGSAIAGAKKMKGTSRSETITFTDKSTGMTHSTTYYSGRKFKGDN